VGATVAVTPVAAYNHVGYVEDRGAGDAPAGDLYEAVLRS
jgi:hypothetical protein